MVTVGKKTARRDRTRKRDGMEYGGRGRKSVNDMYTQTGRTVDRKDGKTARKTKRGKLPKELD